MTRIFGVAVAIIVTVFVIAPAIVNAWSAVAPVTDALAP